MTSVGQQKSVVLLFPLMALALDWRFWSDLASLPSEYSNVLRSTRTIPGLFGTTFNSNWKTDVVVWAIYRLVRFMGTLAALPASQ